MRESRGKAGRQQIIEIEDTMRWHTILMIIMMIKNDPYCHQVTYLVAIELD